MEKETPSLRFQRRCKELAIDFTNYGIACIKHGRSPAVYKARDASYDCRRCVYHKIMYKKGEYYSL